MESWSGDNSSLLRYTAFSNLSSSDPSCHSQNNMSLQGHEDIERGVYRSKVNIDGVEYVAMSNVGIRPSVGGKELLLETHVIGFSGDLYGRRLKVCLVEKLRDEKRFSSIGDLKEQLQRDYDTIKNLAL